MSGRRRVAAALVAAVAGTSAVAGCTDIPSEPDAVFSLGLDPLPFPAVVVGDTLRNEAGAAVPIRATAFNGSGIPIDGANVSYFGDPGLTVTPEGFVIGGPTPSASRRVFASIGGLTTQPETIAVVPAPLTMALVDPAPDSLPYTDPAPISEAVATTLRGAPPAETPDGAGAPVPQWIVRYAIEFRGSTLSDTNPIFSVVVPGGGRLSPADTTDAAGRAERSVALLDPAAVAPGDVAVLVITASYRGQPVGGEPIRVSLRVARQ